MLNSRAYYLVLYLSQGGISLIFIPPLNLCLCNLSGSQVSCLYIIFNHRIRIYNSIIKPLFSPALRSLQTILPYVNHELSSVPGDRNFCDGQCYPKSLFSNQGTDLHLFTSLGKRQITRNNGIQPSSTNLITNNLSSSERKYAISSMHRDRNTGGFDYRLNRFKKMGKTVKSIFIYQIATA